MASKPTAAALPLPSITDLGRALAVLSQEHHRLDKQNLADSTRKSAEAMSVVEEQQWALRDLICTMPARALSDCAVQLGVALHKAPRKSSERRSTTDLANQRAAAQNSQRKGRPALRQMERGGTCIEWCPQCFAPVSNWTEHFERMGHRRPVGRAA